MVPQSPPSQNQTYRNIGEYENGADLFSSLDFLALTGLDGGNEMSGGSPNVGEKEQGGGEGRIGSSNGHSTESGPGPSTMSIQSNYSTAEQSRTGLYTDPGDGGGLNRNVKGKGRGRNKKMNKDELVELRRESPIGQRSMMDVDPVSFREMTQGDQSQQQNLLSYQDMLSMGMTGDGASFPTGSEDMEGMEAFMISQNVQSINFESTGEFDTTQAGILQQQLEHIHMQSPIVFDPQNPQSPYASMAQMYFPSTMQNQPAQQGYDVNHERGMQWRGGILTPGPSGEMFPEKRTEMMSPMELEMLARTDVEGNGEFNVIPLLSPALTHNASGSTFTSPANHAAFSVPNGTNSPHLDGQSQTQLAQLQAQQRQFQEQLMVLQHQQRQMAATAAAVAAASISPYAGTSAPPRTNVSTPSPGYFSPLTSPALPATGRSQYNGFSPGVSRPPHPLSALSSPALNPVGSSGGAQQTLSPALAPQNNADMADPEYIHQLVGWDGNAQQTHFSPVLPTNGHVLSPSLGGSTGPHRSSLPAKSRPSPMMKPTHRPHNRSNSIASPIVNTSHQSSPLAYNKQHSMPGLGYLPPAAIDQRGVAQHQRSTGTASTTSTPSPVDLTLVMPPPPLPSGPRAKGMVPMTPASLMNLGRGAKSGNETGKRIAAKPEPSVPNVKSGKKAQLASPAIGPVKKLVGKLGHGTAGRRNLAIRPSGTVGVRAATKAAAAAAAASISQPEPETRRTSHKAAEQKRRDSLKAGFDELRLLLPPINTEALDPESGEPIPGSSAPRLLPKSSLVPDDNPNRGVSKVALLKYSNEYIGRLHGKVEKRDWYIQKLRDEVTRLRDGGDDEIRGDEGEDLLDIDMLIGEEEDEVPEDEDEREEVGEGEEGNEGEEDEEEDDDEEGDEGDDDEMDVEGGGSSRAASRAARRSISKGLKSPRGFGGRQVKNSGGRPSVKRGISAQG